MNAPQIQPPENIFQRFLRLYGLYSLLMLGILIIGITGLVIYNVLAEVNRVTVEQSDVYRLALQRINSNSAIELALGKPLFLGRPENIIVFTNLPQFGQAHFAIPVSGLHGSGNAAIIASKQDGVWVFEQLTITIKGQPNQIDVLDPTP